MAVYRRRYTAERLAALRHGNGAPVCLLYGAHGLPVPARSAALVPDLAAAHAEASAALTTDSPPDQGSGQDGSGTCSSAADAAAAPGKAYTPEGYPEHLQPQGQAAHEQGGCSVSGPAVPGQAHAVGAYGAAQGPGNPGPSGAAHAGGLQAAPGAVGQGPTVTFSVLHADGSFVGFQCARRPGTVQLASCGSHTAAGHR